MDDASRLLGAIGLYALAMVSPGPNFVVITRMSVAQSRENGLLTGAGVALGSTLWATLGCLSLMAFLTQPVWFVSLVKVVGGGYLLYLGARFLRAVRKPHTGQEVFAPEQAMSRLRAFSTGLFTNLTNPKSAAFFASLFATAISPGTPSRSYLILVGAVAGLSLTWHTALALIFSSSTFRLVYRKIKPWIDGGCGVLLVFAGARLVWSVLSAGG